MLAGREMEGMRATGKVRKAGNHIARWGCGIGGEEVAYEVMPGERWVGGGYGYALALERLGCLSESAMG
jgi:hypothetical protein